MHIPDGYLSPSTCAAAAVVAVPVLAVAARKVGRTVRTADVPLLAVFSALAFLVMMFNIPIPDGTSAHATGAVVVALCLGPWAAVVAVTVALAFQALLFGDGGVLALPVNVLNMAVVAPFVGIAVYRAVAGRAPLDSRRRVWAAGLGGYAGINAAALATAVQLGAQPALFTTASGAPLYSPYPLSQTIPAMMLTHLTVAGAAEAILTAGVFAWLQRADPARLVPGHPGVPPTAADAAPRPRRDPVKVALVAMGVLVLLTPLGLLAPGGAFGEDAPEDLDLAGLGLAAVPEGLSRWNGFFSHALLGGYGFGEDQNPVLGYLVSAAVGIVLVGAVVLGIAFAARALGRRAAGPGPRSDSPARA